MSRRQEPLFARGAAIRSVFGHPAVLFGGGRALMLQLAHPAVARGVAEHSDFAADPFGRLQRTLDAVNAIVYGPADFAYRTAAALREVHARVTGPGYAATDPDLVLWVHATLVDTALEMHARWVRPLPGPVAEAFYAESMVLGELLGAPVTRPSRRSHPRSASSSGSWPAPCSTPASPPWPTRWSSSAGS